MRGVNKNAFLICCDRGYLPHAGTCAFSILLSTVSRDFDIIFVTTGLTADNRDKINRLALVFNASILIYESDDILMRLQDFNMDHAKHRAAHLSDAALLRIFYAEILQTRYEKVVYVDCDIVFAGDASQLFRQELGRHILGAVPDLIANQDGQSQDNGKFKYFNSGVLIIDDDKWRNMGIQQSLLRILRDSDPQKLKYADQDLLNLYFRDAGYQEISQSFNYQYMAAIDKILVDKSMPIASACVIHFAGEIKPWHQWAPRSYSQLYSRFRCLSPWAGDYSPALPSNNRQALIGYQALVSQGRHAEACVYASSLIKASREASTHNGVSSA